MSGTFTPDGETQYELVYEIPDDAEQDDTVYLIEAGADDGARAEMYTVEEFEQTFDKYDPHAKTDAYLRERARNGYGHQ